MNISFTPTPDDDTAAAIIGAVSAILAAEDAGAADEPAPRSRWSTAAVLAAQDLPPARHAAEASWAAAERTRRESRWSYGIVGM